MGLRLAGRWVWDFWLVRNRGLWHVFFLHAPQTPDDPDKRHFAATIGHAVSTDLANWEILADALGPGPAGSWDDMATWTGSVIEHPAGGWAMLYTGVASRERGLVQRIGLARSDDLNEWTKHPANPVIEADPRWYELLDTEIWIDQAWRDPWVLYNPADGLFHAFVTARCRAGDPARRGVIGHATSTDLVDWSVERPLQGPLGFGHMEIPQVVEAGGMWHLLFSAPAWAQASRSGTHCAGTFHAVSDRLTGPYDEVAPLFCDIQESLYGGKIVKTETGLACLAFRYRDSAGDVVGELTDPMPVNLATDGTLTLVESHPDRRS
jgi:beta-fructofuranosidase